MIFDLHNDILTANIAENVLDKMLKRYSTSKAVNKITLALWSTQFDNPVAKIPELINSSKKSVKNTTRFCYALEDLYFIDSNNIDCLRTWKEQYNLIYAGLTWNHENPLAGGALSEGRLSTLGKAVIYTMEKLNIFVDTAHLNEDSFWDVVNYSKKPLINSHCCFDGYYSNPRNLTDSQIKAIIEREGLIGLTLVPKFLSSNSAGILDYFNHIDYFINKFDYRNLVIGTDFYGAVEPVSDLQDYNDFDALKDVMISRGYPLDAIDAIFWGNSQKFFKN